MYVCAQVCSALKGLKMEGTDSCDSIRVLRIEPGFSERTAGALNH